MTTRGREQKTTIEVLGDINRLLDGEARRIGTTATAEVEIDLTRATMETFGVKSLLEDADQRT